MRFKLLLCGMFLLAVLVLRADTSDAQSNNSVIYAGGALPPFTTGSSGGPMTGGYATMVVKRVFNELNVPLTTVVTPFSRALGMVKRGHSDVVFPVMEKDPELDFLRFSKPLYVSRSVMLSALDRKTPLEWGDGRTLAGMTVGLLKGYAPSDAFKSHAREQSIQVVDAKDVPTLFRLIRLGRIDFTILDEISAAHLLTHNSNWAGWIKIGKQIVYEQKMSIGIAKTSPIEGRMEQIDQVIDKLISSGELESLFPGY